MVRRALEWRWRQGPAATRFLLALASVAALFVAIAHSAAEGSSQPVAVRWTATAVSAGGYHTCALTSAGGVKCWGQNLFGELGDGTTKLRPTPVDVVGLTSGVTAIAAGSNHTCALTAAGGVKCWGDNTLGLLGDGTSVERETPVDVVGLTSGVTAIAAGGDHTCALTAAGGVKCWGDNAFGALGDGTGAGQCDDDCFSLFPVDVQGLLGVAAITAGGLHTCALTNAGAVKCWGYNAFGELGDGTETSRSAPVDVAGLAGGMGAITAGMYHTCGLTDAGAVKCWGDNYHGQLGDDKKCGDGCLTPVDALGLDSGVAAIAGGGDHACALTSTGGMKCWGWNRYGSLGDRATRERHTPVEVDGLTSGVAAISAGGAHSCALANARIKCWGSNFHGQLGDGTRADSHAPVGVIGFGGSIECGVPDLRGRLLVEARSTIARAHCGVGRVLRVASKKRRNTVVAQTPEPYTRLKTGAKVDLKVSRGWIKP